MCSCPSGYVLRPNQRVCKEINECRLNRGGCSHGCKNTPGSYECTCPRGFQLEKDNKTCVDINECAIDNGGCEIYCKNYKGATLKPIKTLIHIHHVFQEVLGAIVHQVQCCRKTGKVALQEKFDSVGYRNHQKTVKSDALVITSSTVWWYRVVLSAMCGVMKDSNSKEDLKDIATKQEIGIILMRNVLVSFFGRNLSI